jgi:hypothetical protein
MAARVSGDRAAAIVVEKWRAEKTPKEIAAHLESIGVKATPEIIMKCVRAYVDRMDEARFLGKGKR